MYVDYSILYPCIDRTVKAFLKNSFTPRMGKDELVEYYRDYCLERIYNRLERYKYDASYSFEGWLVTVVRNLCKDCHQSLACRFMTGCESYTGLSRADTASGDDQRVDMLHAKLRLLKPRERQLLRMACIEGKSYKDISNLLGVKASSLGRMIFRAKESLRALMDSDIENYSQAA